MQSPVAVRHVSARVHGRYLVRSADGDSPDGILVGFHGFGETARDNYAELERLPGLDNWTLVSIQALHPFYTRLGKVVACWMTSQDRELAIRDNIAYVGSVMRDLPGVGSGVPLAVLGFSQGTAMAYRAAACCGLPVAGVVALGGDVPPELAELEGLPFERVLIGRGRDEQWYSPEKLAADVALLEARGVALELCEYDGGHEFTDAFREEASRFLRSLG